MSRGGSRRMLKAQRDLLSAERAALQTLNGRAQEVEAAQMDVFEIFANLQSCVAPALVKLRISRLIREAAQLNADRSACEEKVRDRGRQIKLWEKRVKTEAEQQAIEDQRAEQAEIIEYVVGVSSK